MKNVIINLSFLTLLLAMGCEPKGKDGKVLDTVTKGEIAIAVDDTYAPLITNQIDVFDSLYPDAKIKNTITSEAAAVTHLINDSVAAIVIGRPLKADELSYFQKRGFEPKPTIIAKDAIAFIVHPSNKDTALMAAQIKDILQGKTTDWKQINPKSALKTIQIVFDNANSSTVRYALDSISQGAPLPKNTFATNTNPEVISYVSKNPNAIGIIGVNWISDTDDPKAQKFLSQVKVLDIAKQDGGGYFGPYQAYLATGNYAFIRNVYYYNGQGRSGLALGFASFMASDRGQRIILKEGLLPATMPIRLIKMNK